MKRHGGADVFVTDKLRSYGAAMKEIGNRLCQVVMSRRDQDPRPDQAAISTA